MKVSPRQLEQLFQDLEDGCISASDSRKLSGILRTDKEARHRYCQHMAFSSAMNSKAEAEASLGNWKPMDTGGHRLMFRSFLAAAAAVLLLAAIAGFIHINRVEVLQVEIQTPAGTVWSIELPDGQASPGGTTLRESGTVVVRSGSVVITVDTGTRMVVQGPARVKFPSSLRAEVEQGCLWIDTAKGSEQMSVSAGGLVFRDIGTRFAVRVRDGGRPELHVVEGQVRVGNLAQGAASIFPASEKGMYFGGDGEIRPIGRADDPFPGLPALLKRPKNYATVILGQSPAGYWRMNIEDGNIVNSATGVGEASRGTPREAPVRSGVILGSPGSGPSKGFRGFEADNSGVFFRGDTYVASVISNLDTRAGVSTEEGSVAFWFKRAAALERQEVLWLAGSDDADGLGPLPEISVFLATSGRVKLFMEDGAKDVLVSSPRSSTDGEWHHVVATWSPGFAGLYIDGELAGRDSEPRVSKPEVFRGRSVRFGKCGVKPKETDLAQFNGYADEIAIFNRSLTAEEVARQYAAALGE